MQRAELARLLNLPESSLYRLARQFYRETGKVLRVGNHFAWTKRSLLEFRNWLEKRGRKVPSEEEFERALEEYSGYEAVKQAAEHVVKALKESKTLIEILTTVELILENSPHLPKLTTYIRDHLPSKPPSSRIEEEALKLDILAYVFEDRRVVVE